MLKKYTVAVLLVTALLLAACSKSPTVDGQDTGRPVEGSQTAQATQTTETPEETEISPSMGVGGRGDYGDETVPETEPATETTTPATTEPENTEPVLTEPVETTPEPTEPEETTPEQETAVTYSQYLAMTEDEQEAFVNSFPSLQDFVNWWNEAKAAEGSGGDIITGDPSIDLGDLIP